MAITAGRAIHTFDNPVTETKDGTTYVQNFRVPLNGFDTAGAEERSFSQTIALNATGLPQYGHQYPRNSSAFCEKRTATVISGQENNIPTQVIVTCIFSTIPVDKRDEEMNPLAKRPDIMWSSAIEREVILNALSFTTFKGNQQQRPVLGGAAGGKFNQFNQFDLPIINSASEPFNPQPEKDVAYPMVTITQNLPRSAWNSVKNAQMIGTVNSNPFSVDGISVGELEGLLLDRTARTMYQGKLSYREVTTTILIKNTHNLILQDRGLIILVVPVTDDEGNPTGEVKNSTQFGGSAGAKPDTRKVGGEDTPVELLLDGLGNELTLNGTPTYIHYGIHNETDFSQLFLPREKQ